MSTKTVDEVSIYNFYRSILRKLRKQASGQDSRASNRKQAALKATADRYNIRIREVKALVIKNDELKGITHEKPERYLTKFHFEKAYAAFSEKHPDALICEDCNVHEDHDFVRIWPKGFLYNHEFDTIKRLHSAEVIDTKKLKDYTQVSPERWVFEVKCFICRTDTYKADYLVANWEDYIY